MNSQECVSNIHKQTNQRIYDRNVPSQMLQPYIDIRPVMTKYSYFPIIDPRKSIQVSLDKKPTFNIETNFNPGNTKSPWSGYASNINIETELRNQVFALQKCSQAVYVPQKNSSLYEYKFTSPRTYNPHELLFETNTFSDFNPNMNASILGTNIFNNNTRCQVRDMTNQSIQTNN